VTTDDDQRTGDDRDHLGQRRLSRGENWWWYAVAGISYVSLGVWHKWLLNWFVGPVWLVCVLWFGPLLVDLVRPRDRRSGGTAA
jgi:hypothetical protein